MQFKKFYLNRAKAAISFEVFPPKTDNAYQSLREVLPELVNLGPDFMTVTYGALGSTRERTLEIAALIKNQFHLPTACHLTCVGSSRAELDKILDEIAASGVQNIVALRGDPPQGQATFVPPADGYGHANELVAHIRRRDAGRSGSEFGIAVAGYPEKHVEASSLDADLAYLQRKVAAGADCVITQLFYDNAVFFSFVDKARHLGINVPIVPGLLPILSAKQIMRITSICGARIPSDLQAELDSCGDDAARAEEVGVQQCIRQAQELLDRGVPGIHFYVLNKSSQMKRIMSGLKR